MVEPVSSGHGNPLSAQEKKYNVSSDIIKKMRKSHDHVISHNVLTDGRIAFDKFANTFTIYPAKGLIGSRNSNYYEFLTMGMLPYVIGSGIMMWLFRGVPKNFDPLSKPINNTLGKRMMLGVLFFGVAKQISKSFVEMPVNLITGIDVNVPYKKIVNELPDYKGDKELSSIEYHRVFESVDFPYWDMLYYNKSKKRNAYFDKVARKMGLGKDLKDSDQEVKPKIKQVVIKTKAASAISSFLWAGLGVAIALQESCDKIFSIKTDHNTKMFTARYFSAFFSILADAIKSFWNGGRGEMGICKHTARIYAVAAIASSVFGVINSCSGLRPKGNKKELSEINYEKPLVES